MKQLKGFLIDLDGVLYIEGQVIGGAAETVNWLREHGFPFRFLTNTTMRSRKSLVKKLTQMGIQTNLEEMFSTCVVAAHWLKQQGIRRLHLLLPRDAQEDFPDFEITDENPEAVVVGDLGHDFNFEVLNKAFQLIKQGAQLIGLQKNRFWQTLDGLALDVGAFVVALEYASETEATIIGKPNRAYFEMAQQDLGLPASDVAMIGDDIYTDIVGGRAAGLKTILVKTGKYQFDDLNNVDVEPDWIIESIASLPQVIR
jgi:HAD superfamily hydrolase (TIGR01458 family)